MDMSSLDSKPTSADVVGDVFVESNNLIDQDQDDDVKFNIKEEDVERS